MVSGRYLRLLIWCRHRRTEQHIEFMQAVGIGGADPFTPHFDRNRLKACPKTLQTDQAPPGVACGLPSSGKAVMCTYLDYGWT